MFLSFSIALLKLTNIFPVYRPYIALLPTFINEQKSKFQLQVSKNKVVIFFPTAFTDPLKLSTGPLGVHVSQVKNGYTTNS
jgi:hypothetical protein